MIYYLQEGAIQTMSDVRKVVIILRNESNLTEMEKAIEILRQLGIPFSVEIFSVPLKPKESFYESFERLTKLINESEDIQVIICGTEIGMSFPNLFACHIKKPIIAVPLSKISMNNFLISIEISSSIGSRFYTIPSLVVFSVKDAALAAASIISLTDTSCREKLENFMEFHKI